MIYGNSLLEYYHGNISIESKEINSILESFTEATNINDPMESSIDSLNKICNISMDAIDEIKDTIAKSSQSIFQLFKSNGINKNTINTAISITEKTISDISSSVKLFDIKELKFKNYDANKIHQALILFIINLALNDLYITILSLFFGSSGYVLAICVVCPINEELFKKMSIKAECEKEFYVIFNISEFSLYMKKYSVIYGIKSLAVIRVKTASLLHLINTIIQYITNNEKLKEKCGIKKEDKDKISFIGTLCATLYHITWNSLAMVGKIK